jgi:hypothetical protein
VNLLETHLRADYVRGYFAGAFERAGFKTESRKLRIQAEQVSKLIDKALTEMPTFEPFETLGAILGGGMTKSHREKRRLRGKHYAAIGSAERVMLKTLKKAFDSLYRTRADWNRRTQLAATSRMMKAMITKPKGQAQSLLAVGSASTTNPKK